MGVSLNKFGGKGRGGGPNEEEDGEWVDGGEMKKTK